MKNWIEIFLAFLQLGLTSFGGPVAHLSYFHSEFVAKRNWIADDAYADLVALCQFLPGPASSQVGIAIGLSRGGITGSLAAWLGFTLPSAILMMMLGLGISKLQGQSAEAWLHGLKIAAVAVVAQALWSMQSKLCPDLKRIGIALGAAALTTLFPGSWSQVLALVGGAILGYFALPAVASTEVPGRLTSVSRKIGALSLSIFAFLLVILPLWAHWNYDVKIQLMDRFFRTGALVFGGGHAALPLLESAVVLPGWISKDFFMAGYGAAQAIPGPLFTFTAFLGQILDARDERGRRRHPIFGFHKSRVVDLHPELQGFRNRIGGLCVADQIPPPFLGGRSDLRNCRRRSSLNSTAIGLEATRRLRSQIPVSVF